MSSTLLTQKATRSATPLTLVAASGFNKWLKKQNQTTRQWLKAQAFDAKPGSFIAVPGGAGKVAKIVACVSEPASLWDLAALPEALKKGSFVLQGAFSPEAEETWALGWLLGSYRFSRYKKGEKPNATLCLSKETNLESLGEMAAAIAHVRTLITTPAEDMGPQALAQEIKEIGKTYGAKVSEIVGDQLLKKNYPAVHAVGRASDEEPRLLDLTWGDPKNPRLTFVGKGVCFDTGGINLKGAAGLERMQKDKGGAAIALGVARMVMARKLPVRLRLLIPVVENAVDGGAFRPTDILTMRDGTTVEVGNTDAEGRLIVADAIIEAVTEKPDLLIDFTTLTGAARVAVGTEISAFFTDDEKLASALMEASLGTEDPVWRLPLHAAYASMIQSKFADVRGAASSGYAGPITAALFLQRFVPKSQCWVHFDMMGWNLSGKPGRPEGGEAMALRAVVSMLEKRYLTV